MIERESSITEVQEGRIEEEEEVVSVEEEEEEEETVDLDGDADGITPNATIAISLTITN